MRWSIRHKYEDVVQAQVNANRAAEAARIGRLDAWEHIACLAESHFRIAANAARSGKWFDNLYVHRDDGVRAVQMHMGNHPVGSGSGRPLLVESGATVVMSQNHLGSVIILLYPYESAVQRRLTPYLVWELTDHPMTIKGSTLTNLVADFMTYARVSSALFAPSKSDRVRIADLERRSLVLRGKLPKLYLGRSANLALAAGSVGLLFIFCIWLWEARQGGTPSARYEPLAGLIALCTGWLTALLREQSDALRKAEVQDQAQHAIKKADEKAAEK